MKIMINATNLYVGGGFQVACSFLSDLANSKIKHNILIAINNNIYNELSKDVLNHLNYIVIDERIFKRRAKLDKLVYDFQPVVTFSIFGPVYWKPKVGEHLLGFALPWLIYDTKLVIKKFKFFSRIKIRLLVNLQKVVLKHESSYFVTETIDASKRLSEILSIDQKNVFTVSNTVSSLFDMSSDELGLDKKLDNNNFYICYITYPHIHKNLEILKLVADILPNNIKFLITVPVNFYNRMFPGYQNSIINIGPVSNKSCGEVYAVSDAVLSTSLLECFSANYAEAFLSGKVLIASDLPFSRSICGDAAVYVNPYDPINIADAIIEVHRNKLLRKNKVEIGNVLFSNLPTSRQRCFEYLSICTEIARRKNEVS